MTDFVFSAVFALLAVPSVAVVISVAQRSVLPIDEKA